MKTPKMLCVFAVLVSSAVVFSAVPQLINYPGKLLDKNGNPVTGSKSIKFSFYDAETAGSVKWTGTHTVSITKGVFNVLLGSTPPFDPTLDFSQNYWLEMEVESEKLTPRQRITTVAYAMRAEYSNKSEVPMVISGCGDIDENVSEKAYFHLKSIPRKIELYLYGERFNAQHYTELAGHNHGASSGGASTDHTHNVEHTHNSFYMYVGEGSSQFYMLDNAVPGGWFTRNILGGSTAPTSGGQSADHSHAITVNQNGISFGVLSTSQKTYLNGMKVYLDGEDPPSEVTASLLGKCGFSTFGDGTVGHQLNSTNGSNVMDITSMITTTGKHFFVFKQTGLNNGGRIRYYVYITY